MKQEIRAVIIDDEPNSINLLKDMLNFSSRHVKVIGSASDVEAGIALIKSKKPDLAFLDIEMPGGNGFTVLDECKNIPLQVVFVTGYDQYAIQAIKYAALDYLLKPVDLQELEQATQKAKNHPMFIDHPTQVQLLKHNFNSLKKASSLERLVLPKNTGYSVIQLDQIMYIEANGNYTICYFEDNKQQTSTHSLNYFESLLADEKNFFRIHKSCMVNCNFVIRYDKGRGGSVYLKNGMTLPLATRRKINFVKLMNKIGH